MISGILVNKRTGKRILSEIRVANRPWSRVKGLLFSRPLKKEQGLWLIPCNGIHTLGMSYAIDTFYLDKENHVVRILKGIKPYQIGPIVPKAHSVIETATDSLKDGDISLGDQLILQK